MAPLSPGRTSATGSASTPPRASRGCSTWKAPGSHVLGGQPETVADLHGSASNLLLTLHGWLPLDGLRSQGDRATLENFLSWPDLG